MKKKSYVKPDMQTFEFKQYTALLAGSLGASNTPDILFDEAMPTPNGLEADAPILNDFIL